MTERERLAHCEELSKDWAINPNHEEMGWLCQQLRAAEARVAELERVIERAPCSANCASNGGWRIVGPCNCWKSALQPKEIR